MSLRWNRALVTGASSGIGREIARQLAADGTDLVIVARDEQRLTELAAELGPDTDVTDHDKSNGVDVEILVADLTDRTQTALVEQRLEATDHPIDLLVNNAGFGKGGPFSENDRDIATDVLEVNMVAVLRLAHAAANAMEERGRGGILNISSMAGDLVAPHSAVYSATKAFVTSLSESLHAELAPHGVVVTASLPGMTRTEFQDRAEVDVSDIPDVAWQTAAEVAEESLAALAANKPRIVPGRLNKVLGAASRTLPTAAMRIAGRQAMKRQNH